MCLDTAIVSFRQIQRLTSWIKSVQVCEFSNGSQGRKEAIFLGLDSSKKESLPVSTLPPPRPRPCPGFHHHNHHTADLMRFRNHRLTTVPGVLEKVQGSRCRAPGGTLLVSQANVTPNMGLTQMGYCTLSSYLLIHSLMDGDSHPFLRLLTHQTCLETFKFSLEFGGVFPSP